MRWTPGKIFVAMLVVTVGLKAMPSRPPVRRATMPPLGATVLQPVPRPTAVTTLSPFGGTTNPPQVPDYPGAGWTQLTNNVINQSLEDGRFFNDPNVPQAAKDRRLREIERVTAWMSGRANAEQARMAADDIYRSVMNSERRLMESKAYHQAMRDADEANIQAESLLNWNRLNW